MYGLLIGALPLFPRSVPLLIAFGRFRGTRRRAITGNRVRKGSAWHVKEARIAGRTIWSLWPEAQ